MKDLELEIEILKKKALQNAEIIKNLYTELLKEQDKTVRTLRLVNNLKDQVIVLEQKREVDRKLLDKLTDRVTSFEEKVSELESEQNDFESMLKGIETGKISGIQKYRYDEIMKRQQEEAK